jgi:serine phosphatase RsbU (regulator of sigma subunit)
VHQFAPASVLRDLNAVLLADGDDDDHFCSVIFARLELDTCGAWVTLASAGHPLPALIRAAGRVEQRGVATTPVGMFADVAPVDVRVGLGPGDALVFYTDGITEARNAHGDLFGETRLRTALSDCIGRSADETAQRLVDAARAYAGGALGDDAAVLVVKVPDDIKDDPIGRVVAATGVPADELRLPAYPHGEPPLPEESL